MELARGAVHAAELAEEELEEAAEGIEEGFEIGLRAHVRRAPGKDRRTVEGEREDARAPLEQAIALSPTRHEAYNNLGLVLSASGRRDDAIRLFREALRLKPDYGVAERNLRREEALPSAPAP